jgi:hypothetical protein
MSTPFTLRKTLSRRGWSAEAGTFEGNLSCGDRDKRAQNPAITGKTIWTLSETFAA